jgi:diguanylate cyclase (GGDEF)-like protein/PAS domain S-box-containing protein
MITTSVAIGATPAAQATQDVAFYRTVLESTPAVPWCMDWETLRFTYIGPQMEVLLGWAPDSWLTLNDKTTRTHADDRDMVVSELLSNAKAGIDHETEYRALRPDGSVVWIRDVVNVIPNAEGGIETLVGFMFDITAQKSREEELIANKRELEVLSCVDALTGIANRRMFDVMLRKEWDNAQRTGKSLSMVMIDIDLFKPYNDYFGHFAGDECLRQVAQILLSAVTRPHDLVARFGGEEFAILLPDSDIAAARLVAERCRELVEAAAIVHPMSSHALFVTISAGVGTTVPGEMNQFINAIDKALYSAKRQGRNCVRINNQSVPTLSLVSAA